MTPSVDLFCRVVDNYGDIGVCWRLARRLAHGLKWRVRLWVDDLSSFARIAPGIDAALHSQVAQGIEVRLWSDLDKTGERDISGLGVVEIAPHDIVIEAFACELPADFISAMRDTSPPPLWINLEYLSAESWVEDCHALASLRPDGLKKTFFFPGFTSATAGVLREPELFKNRDATQRDHQSKIDALLGAGLTALAKACQDSRTQLVNLFCYPHAPLRELMQALNALPTSGQATPIVVCAAKGVAPSLEATTAPYPHITVVRIPFLAQPDFDRLLWCGDLNIVRGEDSFVRAIWAARPMLWHIYPQADEAHLVKLDAWLARYEIPHCAKRAIRAFNEPGVPSAGAGAKSGLIAALTESLSPPSWEAWQTHARQWADSLGEQSDLAENLAVFWTNTNKKS